MSEVTLSINGFFNSNDLGKPITNPVVPMPVPNLDNSDDIFEYEPVETEDLTPTYSNLAAYRDVKTILAQTSYSDLPKNGIPSAVSVRVALEALMTDLKYGANKPIIKNPAPLVHLLKELTR